jgi:hypothetical protein
MDSIVDEIGLLRIRKENIFPRKSAALCCLEPRLKDGCGSMFLAMVSPHIELEGTHLGGSKKEIGYS